MMPSSSAPASAAPARRRCWRDTRRVLVEAHDVVGGCAHSFARGGYTRQRPEPVGGLRAALDLPLRRGLDAIGRDVDWVQYDGWGLHDLKAKKDGA